jgi:glucose-6-phosphate 1-dehydrogenase
MGIQPNATTDLVVFGASGDLAARKILPAVRQLAARGELRTTLRVIGVGRSDLSDERIQEMLGERGRSPSIEAKWIRVRYDDPESYEPLKKEVAGSPAVIFYLATPPGTFEPIVSALAQTGMARKGDSTRRVVVEKPFGHDLESARVIESTLRDAFDEAQIFRIDHYLAKDTVQNTLAFRFSNGIFEPIWNRTLVDTIQLTVAEDETIGTRAGYYDQSGATRDMVQNHVLQVLALILMEPPVSLDAVSIRRAKLDALRAMRPIDPAEAVRGQYDGYLDAPGVDRASRRETYVAGRIHVDNWRWAGVPIFFRTGKALRRRVTEAMIRFKDAPTLSIDGQTQRGIPTLLLIRVQPDEGITLRIGAKLPGARFEMVPAGMSLEYSRLSRDKLPEAYEHVLSELIDGGHSVFPAGDEIERSWEIVDPLIKAWEAGGHPERYAPGSWGPDAAAELISTSGGTRWINPGDEPGTR